MTRAAIEEALQLPGDVTADGMRDELVARTVDTFGKLDILVSNAAHQQRARRAWMR